MAREIKFRAWVDNKMEYNDIFIRASGNPVLYQGKERPDIILMQFTGLLDKNGKEIYEGDILKQIMPMTKTTSIGPIIWNSFSAAFIIGGDRLAIFEILGSVPQSLEVLGNIYENPELL